MERVQDIGIVVNSSKHGQVGLNNEVNFIKIQVRTSMRVLGVKLDTQLSWEKHIVHVSNIMKKRSMPYEKFHLI